MKKYKSVFQPISKYYEDLIKYPRFDIYFFIQNHILPKMLYELENIFNNEESRVEDEKEYTYYDALPAGYLYTLKMTKNEIQLLINLRKIQKENFKLSDYIGIDVFVDDVFFKELS